MEYLNYDFKESVHDSSTGLKASAHLGSGQTPQGCLEVWGSRGVPPAAERAKRPL